MIIDDIRAERLALQDVKYRDFQAKLIPNIGPEKMIGVRTPALRSLAKQFAKREDVTEFLAALPHEYFDEDQLHAFILSGMKDYAACIEGVEDFLPYINNWATCDQLSPKVFRKNKEDLLLHIKKWIASDETYTVRFAAGMLMEHFLGEDFKPEYAGLVAGIVSDEYYVNMMRAWYFATALAKNYDEALPFMEEKRLDDWTHNKAIQKSVESYRITPEQKAYLKGLKVKKGKKD